MASNKVKLISDFGEEAMTDGEWLGSVHIQALVPPGRKKYAKEWVDHIKASTGLPPIIFVDETQSYASNEWGTIPRLFQAEGCPIVVCTATPFRNDGDDVFGFHGEKSSSKTVKHFTFKANPENDDTLIKTTTSKEVTEFKISADVEVGFQTAWREKVIAKVTTLPVDFTCDGWGTKEGQSSKLSEISESDARVIIPDLVRDGAFISEAVAKMVEQLEEFRRAGVEKPAAIVFGMNDFGGTESNEHQERIKAEIERQSNLECVVATMASDKNGSEKSSQKIADFCCPVKKKGDVLLLKQMGSSGLDVDRCCVVVLLGSVRSQGQVIQQAMRGGNVTNTKKHFVIIYPHEKIMQRVLADWITENGGVFKKEEIVSVESEVIAKGTDNEKGGFIPSEKTDSGAGDHEGSTIPFEDVLLVKFGLTEFPELKLGHTYPQLATKFKTLGIAVPEDFAKDNQSLVETTSICDGMRAELFQFVKDISKAIFKERSGRDFNHKELADIRKLGELKAVAATRIKSRSGIQGTWNANSPERSENINEYRKWVAAASDILREAAR